MATIYSLPEGMEDKVPDIGRNEHWKEYSKRVDAFLDQLSDFLKQNGYKGKHAGEVIKFPHADGYAMYMVAKLRPVQLIHLPIGDAWSSPFAELVTAKKIDDMIMAERALKKIFSDNG